ncbi:MAG: hypothetical protein IJJ45_02370 [Clostridia bacterium]|nr:hypothetical protein [Clostridia bacterium]
MSTAVGIAAGVGSGVAVGDGVTDGDGVGVTDGDGDAVGAGVGEAVRVGPGFAERAGADAAAWAVPAAAVDAFAVVCAVPAAADRLCIGVGGVVCAGFVDAALTGPVAATGAGVGVGARVDGAYIAR